MEPETSKWYADWQHERHASFLEFRQTLDARNLVCNYEAFNDVRLLNERIDRARPLTLLEIGCASGEFYRYLRVRFPKLSYHGLDISAPAIALANAKYPEGRFAANRPEASLAESLREAGFPERPDLIYAKDVVHHQVQPFAFLAQLMEAAAEALIMRCRTRDVGATELNPEVSCQYHYDGWMPYIVINLQELVDYLASRSPGAEIMVYRHHMVLGGRHERFLPKELYLKETGTAETAVAVLKRTRAPGQITIQDREDQNPTQTLDFQLRQYLRRAARRVGRFISIG